MDDFMRVLEIVGAKHVRRKPGCLVKKETLLLRARTPGAAMRILHQLVCCQNLPERSHCGKIIFRFRDEQTCYHVAIGLEVFMRIDRH